MADRSKALITPDEGYELCYECDGKRLCWSCGGEGRRRDGSRCNTCVGRGLCLVCNGDGELPVGTKASLESQVPIGDRVAKRIGFFRELGDATGTPIEQARGKRTSANRDKVVAYLRAGKIYVMTPQLLRDVYDRDLAAGSRSIRTDGVYVWPDGLAHYVERYDVELPLDFEEHMMRNAWKIPEEIHLEGLATE